MGRYSKFIGKTAYFSTSFFLMGYFLFPTEKMHGLFLYIAVFCPVLLVIWRYKEKIIPINWVFISLVCLIFYLFFNSFWSINYSFGQSIKYFRYFLGVLILGGGIFFCQFLDKRYTFFLLKWLIFIGFFNYIYEVFVFFRDIASPLDTRFSRQPIEEAMMAGFLFLACLWLYNDQFDWVYKSVLAVAAISFIMVVLLTKSRGPLLSLVFSIPLMLFFKKTQAKKYFIYFMLLMVFVGVFLGFTGSYIKIFSRGLDFPYRIEIWRLSLKDGFEFFWFGQGASESSPIFVDGNKFTHSHNLLLSIFRMGGVVGVMLFLVNFILCIFTGFKTKNETTKLWVLLLFYGVLCLMTNGRYPLTHHFVIWYAYWIPILFISYNAKIFKIH